MAISGWYRFTARLSWSSALGLGCYLGEAGDRGVYGCIVPKRRIHNSQLDLSAKLGGVYVQSTINGIEARQRGYDEAIFLNLEGRIAEGPGENICVIKDGVLHANSNSESILEGFTRTSLLELAPDLGLKTKVALSPRKTCSRLTRLSSVEQQRRSHP